MDAMINLKVDEGEYLFLEEAAKRKHTRKSEIAKELFEMGRVSYAVNEYEQGRASIEKASKIAGVSISEFMDILTKFGVKSKVGYEDYLNGLKNLREVW